MSRARVALAAILAAVPSASGCSIKPVVSPPIRVLVGSLPERRGWGSGAVQVGGGYGGGGDAGPLGDGFYRPVFDGRLALGLTERITLDLDGFLTSGAPDVAMTSLGVKVFPLPGRSFADLAVVAGFGLGCGGHNRTGGTCGHTVGSSVRGGYVGVDVGIRLVRWFGIYLGHRYQFSLANEVPLTHWHTHALGLQADLWRFFFTLEGGVGGYANEVETRSGGLGMLTVGLNLGRPRQRRAAASGVPAQTERDEEDLEDPGDR